MTQLPEILRLLRTESDRPARAGIISNNGANHESSILATRDGYIHLATQILEFVHSVDEGKAEEDDGIPWGDNIKDALFCFPAAGECSIVGAYLHPTIDSLLAAMNTFLEGVLSEGQRLEDDPDFLEG